MPATNNVGSISPLASRGTLASKIDVAKHPGCATCGVLSLLKCSGTAQVNSRIRSGAPCAWAYTVSQACAEEYRKSAEISTTRGWVPAALAVFNSVSISAAETPWGAAEKTAV